MVIVNNKCAILAILLIHSANFVDQLLVFFALLARISFNLGVQPFNSIEFFPQLPFFCHHYGDLESNFLHLFLIRLCFLILLLQFQFLMLLRLYHVHNSRCGLFQFGSIFHRIRNLCLKPEVLLEEHFRFLLNLLVLYFDISQLSSLVLVKFR